MRVCTVLAERQPFPRNGVSGRNTQRQIYMVAHYQLQHKGTLAEIHFCGEGVAGGEAVSVHVFAGWNQGKRRRKRVLSRIKVFFFPSGSRVITWEHIKIKIINGVTGQQDAFLGGVLEAHIRHVLVIQLIKIFANTNMIVTFLFLGLRDQIKPSAHVLNSNHLSMRGLKPKPFSRALTESIYLA